MSFQVFPFQAFEPVVPSKISFAWMTNQFACDDVIWHIWKERCWWRGVWLPAEIAGLLDLRTIFSPKHLLPSCSTAATLRATSITSKPHFVYIARKHFQHQVFDVTILMASLLASAASHHGMPGAATAGMTAANDGARGRCPSHCTTTNHQTHDARPPTNCV